MTETKNMTVVEMLNCQKTKTQKCLINLKTNLTIFKAILSKAKLFKYF